MARVVEHADGGDADAVERPCQEHLIELPPAAMKDTMMATTVVSQGNPGGNHALGDTGDDDGGGTGFGLLGDALRGLCRGGRSTR